MKFFETLTLALGLALLGCSEPKWSKSELAFFEARSTPLKQWAPNQFGWYHEATNRAYLKTYKPRIFIGPQNFGPVDFYESYLPQAELFDWRGHKILSGVSRLELKNSERQPGTTLRVKSQAQFCRGVDCQNRKARGYARLDYDSADLGEGRDLHFMVLTYQFVIPYRGLPRGLSRLQEWVAERLGDPERWLEFDHQVRIQILVGGGGGPPLLVLISHPGYFRSYLVGRDIKWDPERPGLEICLAERSNQPYPCPEVGTKRFVPVALFPEEEMEFLFARGQANGWLTGLDEVLNSAGGAVPIDYDLAYLPNLDPLNVAWIGLGAPAGWRNWRARLMSMNNSGLEFINPLSLTRPFDLAQFFSFEPNDAVGLRLASEQKASLSDPEYDFYPTLRWNSRSIIEALTSDQP